MTREMVMSLVPGTRVKGVGKYGGPYPDECGTFLKYSKYTNKAIVEWDEYVSNRHTADGTVTNGHGWWVPNSLLEIAECIDYGEIAPNMEPGFMEDLIFGG